MSGSSGRHVTPAELVELATRLHEDEQRPRADVLKRDARLAGKLPQTLREADDLLPRLMWWLRETRPADAAHAGAPVHSALALVTTGIIALGLFMGWGLALGVFRYDGEQPVNVVWALGIFVFLQGVTLVLTVLAALPRSWFRGCAAIGLGAAAGSFQETLRLISPGRLALLLSRLMPQEMREAMQTAVGASGAHRRLYSRVQLWTLLRWSQLFALSLNVAAVITFVFLVTFNDLAFGWGTTLDVEAQDIHSLTTIISLPWAWYSPAVPSLELVTNSAYFRGDNSFDPAVRTAWWSFILLAMLVYGLLPRLVFSIFSQWAVGRACREALIATPGVVGVMRRLQHPVGANTDGINNSSTSQDHASWPLDHVGDRSAIINWARAAATTADAARVLGIAVEHLYQAGGAQRIDDDAQTIQSLAARFPAKPGNKNSDANTSDGVVMLVKLWEPPVIEVTEFLRSLRATVGDGVPVLLWPVVEDHGGKVVSRDPVLREQWVQRIKALGDPWMQVAPISQASSGQGEKSNG